MQWKALWLQSGATFIAVFLGMRFFSPTHTEFNTTLPAAFQAPLHSLEVRLDKIVNMLTGSNNTGPVKWVKVYPISNWTKSSATCTLLWLPYHNWKQRMVLFHPQNPPREAVHRLVR